MRGRAAYFAGLRAVTSGPAAKATAPAPPAPSATPTSSAPTATAAASSPRPDLLADAIAAAWGRGAEDRYVVFTGGEPLLQLDAPLLAAVHARGFTVAIETNGTRQAARGHRLDLRQPRRRPRRWSWNAATS